MGKIELKRRKYVNFNDDVILGVGGGSPVTRLEKRDIPNQNDVIKGFVTSL